MFALFPRAHKYWVLGLFSKGIIILDDSDTVDIMTDSWQDTNNFSCVQQTSGDQEEVYAISKEWSILAGVV